MQRMFQHMWIVFILGTCANGAIWWIRGKKEIAAHPELEEGYRSLIRGWLLFGNLPWIVMGVGVVFGGVPDLFHYFDPRNGPYVIAWYVSVVAVWILTAFWVFVRGGAEALIRHPGLLNWPTQDPQTVKVLFLLALAGGVAGLTMMILGFVPPPR